MLANLRSYLHFSYSFLFIIFFQLGCGDLSLLVEQNDNEKSNEASHLIDKETPTSPTISIDSDASTTRLSTVTLTLGATDNTAVTDMYVTNTPGCGDGGSWESYATSKSGWTLTTLNATSSVYIKFRDAAGNESPCASDSILHDNTPPTTPASFDDEIAEVGTTSSSIATWIASTDSGSGMLRYEIAIGTIAGGTSILNWTNIGNVTSYSHTGLSLTLGTTYYTSLRAIDVAGNVSNVAQGNGWLTVPSVSVAARYTIAPNWNDYAITATPTSACVGNESGYYLCLHGGERRKVDYASATSCTGYSISDKLAAFDWGCDDTGGAGNVFFYSKGLKHDKGLADLVNASAWKDNRVIILQGSTPVAASIPSAWWTNNVTPLPANTIVGNEVVLASSGTIYTLASSTTVMGPYTMNSGTGNKTAIVIFPSARLSLDAAANFDCAGTGFTCLLHTNNTTFNWFEGQIEGAGATATMGNYGLMHSGNFHVIRQFKVSGFDYGAGRNIFSNYSRSLYYQVVVSNNSTGLDIKGSRNTFMEVTVINNDSIGISMGDLANNNIFQNILLANNGNNGFYHYSNQNTVMTAATIINNASYGISFSSDTGSTYHNILAQNNNIDIRSSSGTNVTFSQLAADNLDLNSLSTGKFTANWVSSSSPTCLITNGTNPGLVNSTCATQGASNFVKTTGNGVFALKGLVSVDDIINLSDTNGISLASAITDWLRFENIFRGWGKNGAFPGLGARGNCSTGTCNIWDFRLDSSDTRFRNTTADGVNQNAAFISGGACPSYLSGNVVSVSVNSTPRTYLTNAIEIIGTGGNHNGLCESNETCLYTPNFGAFQGSGDYTQKWCTIGVGTTVQNVTVYAY